jgi:uncharacterized membrane protein YgcG
MLFLLGLFCAIVAVLSGLRSTPWTIERLSPSSVSDPDGLFESPGRLNAALTALSSDHKYPGCGGYEMAIILVRCIAGGTEAAVEAFAKGAMDAWGVGDPSCNNGIVLVIAVDDRQLYIATGRGASEYLPNKELQATIDRMKPLMRGQRYDDAAEQCVSDIARILSGESFASYTLPQQCFAFIIPAFVCLFLALQWKRDRKYNRCKKALSQIELDRAQARADQYQVTCCAICLDRFADTRAMPTSLLRCGHSFHTACLNDWQDARGTCPMCRQPINEPEKGHGGYAPLQRVGSASRPWHYEDEYRFRIRRARTLYPDYVSQNMAERWCAPGYVGPVAADIAFIRSSPSYTAPDAAGGSSSSFSGGCSSGGGGAGGSW